MSEETKSTSEELSGQWRNPVDILSLLLLVGGDIVQKALAQQTGYRVRPFGRNGSRIAIAPVAFSFGWVAFGFTSLMSAVGKQQLMPTVEQPALVVNCANSFSRDNQSWLLERLLRDYEVRHERDKANASMLIDIFELAPLEKDEKPDPAPDRIWWGGWLTIAVQLGIAVAPWVVYGNWGVMVVLLSGTLLALITSAMPQWRQEKWAGARLDRHSVHALTRGNGHRYVMVFIGSPNSYNLEAMATAEAQCRPETPIITFMLATLWAGLLICTSGLGENSWFMVGIGGLGMLQNVYAAGASRSPEWSALKSKPFRRRPTIIARRIDEKNDNDHDHDADVNLQKAAADVAALGDWLDNGHSADQMPRWLDSMKAEDGTPVWLQPVIETEIARAQGALKELEKWVPTAGLTLLKIFFPGNLDYDDTTVRDNVNKKFWRQAWHTKTTRRRAEHARREAEAAFVPKGA
ncbi:uncharacterized protein PAC_15845 [Phialocephala subalpina]|uniref:Uncharacterized protein n=1 Tax=Phialocephala subalpina TaxID=576137 RepID=A0A1L7XLL9_9HELO|nr:uncharacterized protein PAC_15845 [Phialocephala subalpina]